MGLNSGLTNEEKFSGYVYSLSRLLLVCHLGFVVCLQVLACQIEFVLLCSVRTSIMSEKLFHKRGEGLWRIWRKHHVAQPLDHLESSKLDKRCILMVSILIFWNF